eukprot:6300827-Pyramimonas_sp.AAC.1
MIAAATPRGSLRPFGKVRAEQSFRVEDARAGGGRDGDGGEGGGEAGGGAPREAVRRTTRELCPRQRCLCAAQDGLFRVWSSIERSPYQALAPTTYLTYPTSVLQEVPIPTKLSSNPQNSQVLRMEP